MHGIEKKQGIAEKKFVFFAASSKCPIGVIIKKPIDDKKHNHQMEEETLRRKFV